MNDKGQTVAIVPGSFDPITLGHIDIAKRAQGLYDKVYLAVMINKDKKYMFSSEQRLSLAKVALEDTGIEVIYSEGMLWELCRDLSADAIVKGYRNEIDLEYEQAMAKFNEEHYPKAKTILLKANESLVSLSSTVVRNKIIEGEDIGDIVPPNVLSEIKKFNMF